MNPLHARIGSLAAAALCALPSVCAPVGAAALGPSLWYQGSRLILQTAQPAVGDLSVATNDPGLLRFLARVGARLSFQADQKYVVITTADRREISFAVGESDFHVEGVSQSGPFPVSAHNGAAYLPFYTLARALDILAVTVPGEIILEPQITVLDAHEDHGRTVVLMHAAIPLHPEMLAHSNNHIVLRFRGVGTNLASTQLGAGPGVQSVAIAQSGSPRNPTTTLTITTNDTAQAGILRSADPHGTVLAIAGRGAALGAPLLEETANSAPESQIADQTSIAATPDPMPTATPVSNLVTPVPLASSTASSAPVSIGPTTITRVDERPSDSSFDVHLAITGQPSYRWHMLGDGRFYIDIIAAHLAVPMRDESLNDARISNLRIRENGTTDGPSVRLAMGLIGQQPLQITNDPTGLTISIGKGMIADAGHFGVGRVGSTDAVADSGVLPNSDPIAIPTPAIFSPADPILGPAGRSKIIVLDPGHGGSDTGALGNGLVEKTLTLDIARRLKTILVARGWQVIMTRNSDVDVYQPNDSAREELQARCDVANRANARLFVSIHINAFTSPDMQGTTTYYYKPGDLHFAEIVDQRLNALIGTQDDGARRENYYVVRHTTMPSILVETAFLSNSGDAARLRQPNFRQNVAQAISEGITAYTAQPGPIPAGGVGTGGGTATSRGVGDPPADDLAP